MSEILPIVKVKHKKYGIEMLINESDFNEQEYEKLDGKKVVEEDKTSKKNKDVEDELKTLMGV